MNLWADSNRKQWAIRNKASGKFLTDAEQNPETPGIMLWNTRQAARENLQAGEQVVRVRLIITSERG